MRPTRVVGRVRLLADPFIPVVAVTVESPTAVTIDTDVVAAKNESGGLILVTDIQGVCEPVRNIGAPLDASC